MPSTGDYPLVARVWCVVQNKGTLVTIVQHGSEFVATATYTKGGDPQVLPTPHGSRFNAACLTSANGERPMLSPPETGVSVASAGFRERCLQALEHIFDRKCRLEGDGLRA